MQIDIVNIPGSLLSSVYGFFDIINFACKKFRPDIHVSVVNPGILTEENYHADILFFPAFMDVDLSCLLSEYRYVVSSIPALHKKGIVLCSVCAGSFFLAESGIADGYEITTHWKYFTLMEKQYPAVTVNRSKILIDNGAFITGGGVTSYQDLALYLIESLISEPAARTTAKVFLLHREKRVQLEYIIRDTDPAVADEVVQKAVGFIQKNFSAAIGLKEIAAFAAVSPRTLNRRFVRFIGITPHTFLKTIRLEYARELLETTDISVQDTALRCGYTDFSSFYRMFSSELGMPPGEYRNRNR